VNREERMTIEQLVKKLDMNKLDVLNPVGGGTAQHDSTLGR